MNEIVQIFKTNTLEPTGKVDVESVKDQLYTLIKNEVIDNAKARPGRTLKEDATAKLDALFGKES